MTVELLYELSSGFPNPRFLLTLEHTKKVFEMFFQFPGKGRVDIYSILQNGIHDNATEKTNTPPLPAPDSRRTGATGKGFCGYVIRGLYSLSFV